MVKELSPRNHAMLYKSSPIIMFSANCHHHFVMADEAVDHAFIDGIDPIKIPYFLVL